MLHTPRLTPNEKYLIRRYLIWCYKTTKETLDRIDRYFTQLQVDCFVLRKLEKTKTKDPAYNARIQDFKKYMQEKETNVLQKKFLDPKKVKLQPHYQYLKERFLAIERSIVHFLGKNELNKICSLYEDEMTRRILEAKEHV